MRDATHRVRFDPTRETCVAVCSCGRRALGLTPIAAARAIARHIDAAAERPSEVRHNNRRLRMVRPA